MPDTQEDATALASANPPSLADTSGTLHDNDKIPFWPEYQSSAAVQSSSRNGQEASSPDPASTPSHAPHDAPPTVGDTASDRPQSHRDRVEGLIGEQTSAQDANAMSITNSPSPGQQPPSPTDSSEATSTDNETIPSYPLQSNTPAVSTAPTTPPNVWSPFSLPPLPPQTTSSFLRPSSHFTGIQQSDSHKYTVSVTFQYVDLSSSFLCGYLTISGLTPQHSHITTYFEAEIIGPHHSFLTNHPGWGATEKIDMEHWEKFPAFRPLARAARRGEKIQGLLGGGREHVFMRWKEKFLVPDHRVKEIFGASFEGFYYICASRTSGDIQGIYFHARGGGAGGGAGGEHGEKYQKLELKHVDDKGQYGAIEFR